MPETTQIAKAKLPPRRLRLLRTLRKASALLLLLWPYARPHKGRLLLGAVFSVGIVAVRLAQPWPLKWVIDALSGSPSHHQVFPWLSGHPQRGLVVLAGLYVWVSLLGALAEYGHLMTLAGLGNRVLFSFRSALFARVLRQPLSFHERRETGELLTRVVYDTARLRQGINGILTRIFLTVFTFVAILTLLFWLDVRLAAAVGLTGFWALSTMGHSSQRIFRAARKQRKREGRLAAFVADKLLAIRELQTFSPGMSAEQGFERYNRKSLKQEQKVRRLAAALLVRVEVLLAACITLILWLGARAVQAGRLTPGDLVLFVHYVVALYRPFQQFARQTARSGKAFASAKRLTKIMEQQPAIADLPGAIPAPPWRGEILFEDASVKSERRARGSRKWALESISCRIEPGQRVAVLGHNGAGKSTLLRLVLRLVDPQRGRVVIDGHGLREYSLESLRRQISVVFQDSLFLSLSVGENIALGRPEAGVAEVKEAARRSRVADLIERLPEGYDTRIRQRGKLFSVGERQRIAIARALLRDGRIWLLDEPTTGLDAETAAELIRLLLEATRGRTVLWVTHDARILHAVDRIIVLREGQLQFAGTSEEYGLWVARSLVGSVPLTEEYLARKREE